MNKAKIHYYSTHFNCIYLLNDERITHVYEFLINDIENLGSKFEFSKINDYYSIVKRLDIVNRHDLKYIDNELFNQLEEQVESICKMIQAMCYLRKGSSAKK